MNLKIALGELDIKWEDKKHNMDTCHSLIKEASKNKVDLVIFPEMSLTGFSMNTNVISENNLDTFLWFKSQAEKYKMSIGFGWVRHNKNFFENIYSIISEDLNSISYSKIHLFSPGNEDKFYTAGKDIFKIKIKDFNICPFICYDLRFPDIFMKASKDCGLITVSANWPAQRKEHFLTLLSARAIENQCYIAGVNRRGLGNGVLYSGDSCIFDPDGNRVTSKVIKLDNNLLFISEISMDKVLELRKSFNMG